MLVLSRYRDESIHIGDDIVITIVDIRGDRVRLGVQAPPNVSVHRKEVYEAIKNEGKNPGSLPPKAEQSSVLVRPVISPLSQELSKRRSKISSEAQALPVDIDPPAEFGGLTSSDIIPQ